MVNSLGAEGEKAIWGKRADWVNYDGRVEGEDVGIAVLDHIIIGRATPERQKDYSSLRELGYFYT